MHRYNRKYGHDQILRTYCGLQDDLPVLGELQHSLFVSRNHFDSRGEIGPPRKTGAMGFPFFSWNALIPFKNQVPIGDPLIYDPQIQRAQLNENHQDDRIPLVMPKFNEELSTDERLDNYRQLIRSAAEYSSSQVRVSLHPGDAELEDQLARDASVVISPKSEKSLTAYERLSFSMTQIAQSSLLVSDYFAAHVFRATYFFEIPVRVIELTHQIPWSPKVKELIEDFQSTPEDSKARLEIARIILGTGLKKGAPELRNLLYRECLSLPSRKAIVSAYKSSRRVGVRIRESRFGGKSKIASWYHRKIAQPIWASKFR